MAVGMMSRVGPRAATAYISVRGDFSPFDQQIKNEQGRAKARFAAIGKAAAAGVAVGVAVGGKAAVKAAVDLGEQINKTKVVFRGHEKTVLRWSKTTATAIGTSRREALEAAGVFGNMLVPMGFARGEAAKMSTRMVKLAADMASFNNASPAETLDALRAGLAGETEPLRRYGIFLNDARLKQVALNMGLKDAIGPTGALTASAKAQATYALILKDSADAQGDFRRTSGSLANQQRILKAQVEDVGASVGKQLIPPLTVAARQTSKFIRQMQNGKGPGGEFAAVVGDLAEGAKDAAEFVGPVLLDIGKFAAKHDSVVKVAGGVTALALGLKGIKGVGRLTGLTDLVAGGRGVLGRGGGGIASKATPVPVFVTNMGGLPGAGGGKAPGGGGVIGKIGKAAPVFAGGPVVTIVAGTALISATGPQFKGGTAPGTDRNRDRVFNALGGKGGGGATQQHQLYIQQRDKEQEEDRQSVAARALNIRSLGQNVEALRDRVIAGRRLVERLKQEGASTDEVSRAEKTARARTFELKQAQLQLAEATGASRQKIERLRGEVEKLRSKRISVAVDINIPSLNVRAPGNLTGTGPQGPGMRTGDSGPGGDGWGIEGGISRKVAEKVRASARKDPMAFLIAAGGGPVGGGPGAYHAFDPIAGRFGLRLTSGYRPGSITSSGNLSYHAMNRAGDYADGGPAMLNFARFMAAAFGSKLKELIHTPLGFSIKNGARVAPYAQADHLDHVHVALQRGGGVDVPGRGSGDKVPMTFMAEPKERVFVLNRNAVPFYDALNKAIPRFQRGGTVTPEYKRLIQMASKRYGIPANVLAGLIQVESSWNPNAVSPAGAFGLTQFMPGTASGYGVARGSGHHAVATQILGAARYLKDLGYATDRRRALGAYNGGPGNPQYGYADDVIAAAAAYVGIGAGPGGGSSGGRGDGTREDSAPWNWASMGNRRRGVFVKGRKKSMAVGQERFARLFRQGKIDFRRTKRLRGDRLALRNNPGAGRGLGTGKPWAFPKPSTVLEAFLGQAAEQLALREARAALTPGTEDDLAVAQDAAQMWRTWLDVAERNKADAPTLTGILQNIKSAEDAVAGFQQEERDRLAEAIEAQTAAQEANTEIMRQVAEGHARNQQLINAQGPALMQAFGTWLNSMTGASAGRGRQFPSHAGVGGLARA